MNKPTKKQIEDIAKRLGVPVEQVKETFNYINKNPDDFLQPGEKGFYKRWGRKMNRQLKRKPLDHPKLDKIWEKQEKKEKEENPTSSS